MVHEYANHDRPHRQKTNKIVEDVLHAHRGQQEIPTRSENAHREVEKPRSGTPADHLPARLLEIPLPTDSTILAPRSIASAFMHPMMPAVAISPQDAIGALAVAGTTLCSHRQLRLEGGLRR